MIYEDLECDFARGNKDLNKTKLKHEFKDKDKSNDRR